MEKKLKVKFSAYKPDCLGFEWIGIKTAVLDVPLNSRMYNSVFSSKPILHVGRSWNFAVTILNYCFQVSLFYGYVKNLAKEYGV